MSNIIIILRRDVFTIEIYGIRSLAYIQRGLYSEVLTFGRKFVLGFYCNEQMLAVIMLYLI